MKARQTSTTAIRELDAHQLRGKQSVRATFRLPEHIIDLLKVAADHLGVKQKSLIDQLVENEDALSRVAGESQFIAPKEIPRRQKTFILSRKALAVIDEISQQHDMSRDLLVELSISRLVPFVDAEQEKHKRRRALARDMEQYLRQGKKLLAKADKMLDQQDRFRIALEELVTDTERNVKEMRAFVKANKSFLYR